MASFRVIATVFLLLVILELCEARNLLQTRGTTTVTAQERCLATDINIQQFQTSGVGIPTWQVQIINECSDTLCLISEVIVDCGAFHSPTFVNPKLFRRLDDKAGTCIVNDGNGIPNGNTITFKYSEIVMEPLKLRSAQVACLAA